MALLRQLAVHHKNIPLSYTITMDTSRIVYPNLVMEVVTGSTAYHLNTPTSDTDLRGIFIGPPSTVFGLSVVETFKPAEGDSEYKSLREAFHQLTTGVVNWMELLWVDEDMVRTPNTEETLFLRANREFFTSKRLAHKAMGFMTGMLNRAEQSARTGNPNLPKEVMHGVRIGHMIVDYMLTGILSPNREYERDYLLGIRHGITPIPQAVEDIREHRERIENLLDTVDWQDAVDMEKANKMLIDMYVSYWKRHGEM